MCILSLKITLKVIPEGASFVCKYSNYFSPLKQKLTNCSAMGDTSNPSRAYSYGMGAAVSTLRKHLISNHLKDWVEQCEALGLMIKGKEGQQAAAALTGSTVRSQAQARPQYSSEALVDALVNLIVANDLVCDYLFIFINFPILFSLLAS